MLLSRLTVMEVGAALDPGLFGCHSWQVVLRSLARSVETVTRQHKTKVPLTTVDSRAIHVRNVVV
jgi:hypothetical protein